MKNGGDGMFSVTKMFQKPFVHKVLIASVLSAVDVFNWVNLILSKTTSFRLFQTERVLQTTIINLTKMAERSLNR